MAEMAIEADLNYQKELIDSIILRTTKEASIAAMEWFNETFEDDLLEQMEKKGLISQAEGFRISSVAELQANIEIKILGKLAE